jgi:F-type H+-transporting ATPase subunit b
MDQTLRQLGELLLASIPTAMMLGLLTALYLVLVHKPLVRILAERRSRTEGAMEKARADVAAAEARTADYEQRLREARAAVFRSQEQRRQQALQARADILAKARAQAQARVQQERANIEKDKQDAMVRLQADASRLASDIIRVILEPVAAPSRAGGI